MSKSKSTKGTKSTKSKNAATAPLDATPPATIVEPNTPSQPEIKSAPDLFNWITQHLHLKMPLEGVCPGHCSPFEYLRRAFFEPAQDLVVIAPRGGGKTRMAAAATLLDLLFKRRTSIRILGGSLEQSLRVWEHLLPDLEALCEGQIKGKIGARKVAMQNGASAGIITQSQRAVRGLRVQKLRCDEVELFDPEVWAAAQLVTRSRPPVEDDRATISGAVEALSTCHIPGGLMERIIESATVNKTPILRWCILDVLEQCPEERVCATCPLQPECQGIAKKKCDGFISIDDAIRAKSRVSAEQWESEMLCRRPITRGAVFPSFDPAIHIREELPANPVMEIPARPIAEGIYVGMDFGFNAPLVALFIRRDRWERSFIIDEYVQSGQTMDEHVLIIKEREKLHGPILRIGCDPAGNAKSSQTALSDIQILRARKWNVRSKASRIADGLERIRAGLKTGAGVARLFIHPRCQRLIAAMKSYRYPDGGAELPIKDGTHDHLIDALRYYYINRGDSKEGGVWY